MRPSEFLAAEDERARKERLQKDLAALPPAQPLIALPDEAMVLWRRRYDEELRDLLGSYPERSTAGHHAAAIREANRCIFSVPPVESLEEARANAAAGADSGESAVRKHRKCIRGCDTRRTDVNMPRIDLGLPKRWTRKGCLFAAILKLVAMARADHLDVSLWMVLTRLSYPVSLAQLQAAVMELSRVGLLTCECCRARAGDSFCLSTIRITSEGRAALVWFKVNE